MEVGKESRGGIYLTMHELAPHSEEPVEIVIIDEVFHQACDRMISARLDSRIDMRQGPSEPGPKPDDERKDEDANKENQGEDDGGQK